MPSLLNQHWRLKNTDRGASLIDRLFANRNIISNSDKVKFFNSELADGLYDPFLMKNMEKAVERILKAIKTNERIMIFGDYDVDGITSTTVMVQVLSDLGAKVSYRLPHRVNDGYGLNENFINEFAGLSVGLLITVDCGIASASEVALAKEKNIDTIITDHHTVPQEFPSAAYAVVHPKQEGCKYPFKDLAGVGVAFKLAHALIKTTNPDMEKEKVVELLDLTALGTIADCVPLIDENRIIVKHGLKIIKKTGRKGLKILKDKAGIPIDSELNTYMIGYSLAPRLNAAGRMDNPYYALQLLLSEDDKAIQLAEKLEELNKKRQQITLSALEQIEADSSLKSESIILRYNTNWHIGIVGLIAGKLAEKFFKPALIMEERDGYLFGSGRSPEYFNLVDALRAHEDLLETFGGHRQAAGFALKKINIEKFEQRLKKYMRDNYKLSDLKPVLSIDCEIEEKELDLNTVAEIEKFAPFGVQNEPPVFLIRNAKVEDLRLIGSTSRHIKFKSKFKQKLIDSIAFNFGDHYSALRSAGTLDLVCEVEKNVWKGNVNLQMKIKDMKITG